MEIQENCGIYGIYSNQDCIHHLFHGIFKLQHRGQRYCGIATFNKELKLITHRGFVRHSFTPEELQSLSGNIGIGHVSLSERQPVLLESKLGLFVTAFSGNIMNAEQLFEKMKKKGHSFSSHTQVELIAKIIGQGKNFVDGIEKLAQQVKGSYTIVILTKDGIYATRDKYGFKPLILGKSENEYVVSSESRPFSMFSIKIVRDVKPGEIVFIGKNGIKTVGQVKSNRIAYCAFEWGYIASMDSIIEGVPVVTARKNLGASLAKNDHVDADIVAAIPFSGIGYALGYHKESKIPYDEVFLIDRFASRSYLPLTQEERDREAKIKLSVIEENVRGKRIILCDDSIVRGTQIRNKVLELKAFGAKEVHVRVGCPPLLAPCLYDISTRSYKELAAKRYSINQITKKIGADTLKYNSVEDFVKALGLPEHHLCLHCWTEKKII
ncbi:MAG TPA: amidophosphoribosyltransferase [bacterium]|nr:amidophosphoribosyltransferase [bacterium]HPO51507.1 amidophosphoribosyltransferase [bacterium]HXK45083.1 amidophosphoribosyltransferase [bacterium]